MNVKLRSLNYDDIPYMEEFFLDYDIKKQFTFTQTEFNFIKMRDFIDNVNNEKSVNFAIEVNNEYAGTVSLKNLDYINFNAEYAIVVRKKFWGTGISFIATSNIIDYAFKFLKLNKVYLNVLSSNSRAIKFYEKMQFKYEGTFTRHIKINNSFEDLNWYGMINKNEVEK